MKCKQLFADICRVLDSLIPALLLTSCPPLVQGQTYDLGGDFALTVGFATQLSIDRSGREIWATASDDPFLSASAGNDTVKGSDGSLKIGEVDESTCVSQNITSVDSAPWSDSISGESVVVSGYLTDCGDASAEYAASFWVPKALPDRIAFRLNVAAGSNAEKPLTKLYFKFRSNETEDFYGLGAQGSFASFKDQVVPIFSREQGVGRGDQPITQVQNGGAFFAGGDHFTAYTAIPQYISTAGNVFYLKEDSSTYAHFDFSEPEAVTIRYDSLRVNGHFMQAASMLDAVTMLTDYTGRMPALPEWVHEGAVLGIQGGQDKVNEIVKQGQDVDCPIAAVWLQDWCGSRIQEIFGVNYSRLWWNWEADQELYPTWSEFVQDLRDQNVRTMSYINTFYANVSDKASGFQRNLFAEADAKGYTVQNASSGSTSVISSGPGIDAGVFDLTNPDAREWMADVMRSQVWNANISGFMADFGEYTPVTPDTVLAGDPLSAFDYHNKYPREWAEFQYSVLQSVPQASDGVMFHRSASFGANRHMNLFWAGDQNIDWGTNDGLKSAVTIMGHMGLSGYAQSHSDIGGYTNAFTLPGTNGGSITLRRSPELLGRWGEMAAVSSAVFRSHEGNAPQINAQFYTDASTYAYYAYNARMFKSLSPYRRRVLDTEAQTKGWPLLRMPVLYHIDDAKARDISYQSFFLGADLYVAPVVDPGVEEVEVYFPGNGTTATYTHVWTGATFESGQTERVPAPYGKPAVFVVNGAQSPELDAFLDFVREEKDTKIDV